MSENNITTNNKPGLLVAVRVMYIISCLTVLYEIIKFIIELNYINELSYWVRDTSVIFFIILIVAFCVQFPYVFLNRNGQIKGKVIYLVGLVMFVSNVVIEKIYLAILFSDMQYYYISFIYDVIPYIIIVIILAIVIVYYFLLKELDKGREALSYEEKGKSLFKKIVEKIKENKI